MFNVVDYGRMIQDSARLDAYTEALRRVVTRESVVADIGAGTGIFTVLACRLGARKVYAIEPNETFNVLREVIAENGITDRVECYRAFSSDITLPERASVVISDLRGAMPLYDHNISAVIDARERHLAPGGSLIASVDTLRVAVASAPETYARLLGPWIAPEKVAFSAVRRYVANEILHPHKDKAQLQTKPQTWFTLDYRTVTDERAAGTAELQVERGGEAHGLYMWFDCETAPGVRFSNAPGVSETSVYQQRLLPWPEAVALQPGEVVQVELHADPAGEDYVWRWNTEIRGQGGKVRKQFSQSTFYGSPFETETLSLRAGDHRPTANEEGMIARLVLAQMDGARTLAEIAEDLCRGFPRRFRGTREALDCAAELSAKYSRRS